MALQGVPDAQAPQAALKTTLALYGRTGWFRRWSTHRHLLP